MAKQTSAVKEFTEAKATVRATHQAFYEWDGALQAFRWCRAKGLDV